MGVGVGDCRDSGTRAGPDPDIGSPLRIARLAAPALAIAVALRLALSCAQPAAYFQYDTHDYLLTADLWFSEGEFKIHKKRTPLYPLFLLGATAIPVPAAVLVPALQHLLGVGAVLAAAYLAASWFGNRRWVILGASLPLAVNPLVLWYEHALLAESIFVALVLFAGLAGTRYARAPGRWTLAFFLFAAAMAAIARPEGKVVLMAAAVAPWIGGGLRRQTRLAHAGIALATACLFWPLAKTSQTGVLPLTGVLHLMPDEPRSGDGLGQVLIPLRDETRKNFPGVSRQHSALRKAISKATEEYLRTHPELGRRASEAELNALCRSLAREIYVANWWRLPGLAFEKFCLSFDIEPAPCWTPYWLLKEQGDSLLRNPERLGRLAPRLFGERLDSPDAVADFLQSAYHPARLGWANAWMGVWEKVILWRPARSTPDAVPGPLTVAWPYWSLALGMLCCAIRRNALRPWHRLWATTFGTLWFGIFLTAGIEARFRIAWEPWLPIYFVALCVAASSWFGQRHPPSAKDPAHAARNHSQA